MQASGPGSSCGDRDAIEAEAARLLARLENNPSPQDEADICAWIEADPRHAILLFIVAAIVTVRTYSGIEHFETGVGQMRDIALEDGSTLHLNSDSEVEARFTSNGRKVRVLKGEASFEISHDPDRPFDVEARAAVIRAVGTAFNVRLRPSLVELTVTHGTVTVHSGDSPQQQVVAGSGAVIQPRSIALTRLGPRLIEQRTAWREQMVELDGETVEQAAGEFNRYRKTPILIGDTRVSALRIGGRFRTTDSREFLTALQTSLPVRAVDGEDGSVMLLYRDETASAGDDAGE